MAALRKASAYSSKKVRPYTRVSKIKNKAFIKTVPQSKIVKFFSGNKKAFEEGKYNILVKYINSRKVQVRDNALEASRLLVNKSLDRDVPGQYFMELKVYPHHILRENKVAAGAGADRMSKGMKLSFGASSGRAAIIGPEKEVFVVWCANERVARLARDALGMIKSKIPCRGRIVWENLNVRKAE